VHLVGFIMRNYSQSSLIPLNVNIPTYCCRNMNVFDYRVLPQTPLGMSHYILVIYTIWYMHRIAFLKPEKF